MIKFSQFVETFQRGIKNASFVGLGTFISQIIGFFGLIFIARLLGPKDFGVYATVLAFVSFFYLFTLGGMQKIVVREGSKDIGSFSQILDRTIGLKLIFVIAAALLCIGICFFTNYPPFTKVLVIIFSTEVIYFGLDSFLAAIYQTAEKMQFIAIFQVLVRVSVTGLSVLVLMLGAGVLEILLVNLFSKFFILVLNYFWSKKFHPFHINWRIHFDPNIVKATIIFSLMGFINMIAVKIDVLMVSFLSTSTDVGIYSVAHEIGREGLILRNILAMAFFPIAVKFFMSEKVKIKTILSFSLALWILIFLGCIFMFFVAEDLIVFLFKSDYSQSGHILRYLVFYLPFAFSSLPFTISLQATHNEKTVLYVMCLAAGANIPLNLVFFSLFGLVGIAYSTVAVFFLSAVAYPLLAIKKLKKDAYLI